MSKPWRILLFLLLLAAAVGLRAPYLQHPLWNLDEGVTFTTAQQILDGAVIYRDAADHRNPLVPYLQAAVLAIAGNWNATAVHLSLTLLLGLGAIGLWQLCRRLGDEATGLVAAGFFTLLCFTLPEIGDAMAAHTEWYLILFSVAAFWSLAVVLPRPDFRHGLVPGALFGFALLCKQPGLLDFGTAGVLIGLLILNRPGHRAALVRLLLGLVAGLALMVALALAYFAWHGAMADLVYYAWTYNSRIYVPEIPLPQRLPALAEPFRLAWRNVPVALAAGLLGALLMLSTAARGLWRRPLEIPLIPWLALGWTASGIIAASLSGRTFSHYSIQVIPGLSLACGWGLVQVWHWSAARPLIWRGFGAVLFILTLLPTGRQLALRYRALDDHLNRPEMLTGISEAARSHTQPDERIFVWGFAPDIHFRAQRLPNSRFLYSNFLTGLVPWTNLDPLKDTAYAVTPGSWEQLQADFARTPAAVIVDIGALRGNIKYPLHQRAWLWDLITSHYAEVSIATAEKVGMRLYRRLLPADGHPLPPEAVIEDSLRLTIGYTNEFQPVPKLSVSAPAGATRIDLFANGRLFRALPLPANEGAATFFAPARDLPGGTVEFQAVAHTGAGLRTGPPVTVVGEDPASTDHRVSGPPLTFGDHVFPVDQANSNHAPGMTGDAQGRWFAHAPSWARYSLKPAMQALVFSYGLEPASYDGSADGRTDGITITVTGENPDGTTATLFTRTLNPAHVVADRGTQTTRVELAPTHPRRVTIAVGPGPHNNYAFDWGYLAEVHASGPGPDILLDTNRRIPATALLAPEGSKPARDPGTGFSFPNVPSQLVYPCPDNLATVTFTYGLADTAVANPAPGRHSDGIDVLLHLLTPDGQRQRLFQRRLQPVTEPTDRGPQTASVALPPGAAGQLIFELTAGRENNTDFDWGYWGDFRGTLHP